MGGLSSFNGSVEREAGGARRGQPTGEVICPQLKGAIALERCWWRQAEEGCASSCPHPITTAEFCKLKAAARQQTTYPADDAEAVLKYGECIECGNEKSLNPSPRCHVCAGERRRKEGKR